MYQLVAILVPLGCCVVLPCIVVWLGLRYRTNTTNRNTEVILHALEKNPQANVKEIADSLRDHPTKSLKKQVINYLLVGTTFALSGLFLLLSYFALGMTLDDPLLQVVGGGLCLAIGIAFLIVYAVSKKHWAKELSQEEAKELSKEETIE